MELEINMLIESNHKILNKLGWLLYNRENQDGGLSKDELNELLHIVNEDEIERIYVKGYNDGYDEGICIS